MIGRTSDVSREILHQTPWETPLGSRSQASPMTDAPQLDAHVVILNNYLRQHHVASYRELAKRVRKVTILLSVPMEPDRNWDPHWEGLDVRLQKNWMVTTKWKHSAGFQEPNFIHLPIDTNSQLKSLRPDIVFSYEMGMRTMLSSWYRRFHRDVPLVMVGNMSEHIERERGWLRRSFRYLVKRNADYFTYNGPSCKRYLGSLGIPESKLFHLPYCIDEASVYRGERAVADDSQVRRLVYVGALSQRKGILQLARALQSWSHDHPQQAIELSIAGTGELAEQIRACETNQFSINLLGNCNVSRLRDAYSQAEICVFPSLADEWGLVPIEAMASGLPVLGSPFAQSVESVVVDGANGWTFDPTELGSMRRSIDQAMNCTPLQLLEMGRRAKQDVAHISATATADRFCEIINAVRPLKAS